MAIDSKESPKKKASEHLKNADRLLKAGQLQEAMQEIEQALSIDPRNAYALAYQQRIKSAMDQAPKTAAPPKTETTEPPKVEVKETPKVEIKETPKVQEEVQKKVEQPEVAKKSVRKLAAIMFTDIVGYTAITQRNETLSLQLLEQHRDRLRPIFTKHEGKEIKTLGDSFLVEFESVLHAVRCAIDIQDSMVQYNNNAKEEHKMLIRIGVHLGDVVYQENDIFGDGVNIASRLQTRANPGGICISQDVYNQIRNRGEFESEYVGEVELKNVLTPIPLYKILTKGEMAQRTSDAAVLKAQNEAVLDARIKKSQEYVSRANDLIAQGQFNDAIIEVMKLRSLTPESRESKDLEEKVRTGKRGLGSAEIDKKKKVPKENVLAMYTNVVEQAFSAGALNEEEKKALKELRVSLEVSEEEHAAIEKQARK